MNGFVPFPADNAWNQDISQASVDPNSDAIINFIRATVPLHPDFGAGLYHGKSIGIPYDIVSGDAIREHQVHCLRSESDPGPMPIPATPRSKAFLSRGMAIATCWCLTATIAGYELYSSYPQPGGIWDVASAAVWDLLNDEQRPYTWTSADAAGLPIFPGLARYDEVAAGKIQHALRFTLQYSREAFTPPASHWAPNSSNDFAAPMGMRMRLKASYDISSFPPQAQVILAALQQYGMIMADNGSSIYISGDPDNRWNNDDLGSLKQVPASAFEVILMDPIYTPANLPKANRQRLQALPRPPLSVRPDNLSF